MTDALDRVVVTREAAHQAAQQAYALAQAILANGDRVRITCAEDQDDISVKQRAFLHAAVFPQIAEQVVVEGARFTADVWKEHLRQLFLPDRWELRYALVLDKATGRLRRAKRKTPHRVRRSTEELGIKGYSRHIDSCIDHAVLNWGVVFEFRPGEREEIRYAAPARKAKLAEEVVA